MTYKMPQITHLVVLVPESGDEVQLMKAGIIEIADIFCYKQVR
jgi:Putative periplasmic protein kinase ArgK and related GTPases of G3E family